MTRLLLFSCAMLLVSCADEPAEPATQADPAIPFREDGPFDADSGGRGRD